MTFHDLRAHFATRHKDQIGHLPDLHASPTTKVYERSAVSRRNALSRLPFPTVGNSGLGRLPRWALSA
jgi:hypothetical protein